MVVVVVSKRQGQRIQSSSAEACWGESVLDHVATAVRSTDRVHE